MKEARCELLGAQNAAENEVEESEVWWGEKGRNK
jgi:hypothetical protein